MRLPSTLGIRPGQAILFAPAALLLALVLTFAWNAWARPVVRAVDSPDGSREALVFLEYSPAYPFSGEVRAVLEVRRLPGHQSICLLPLGSYRWSSQALGSFQTITWQEPGKVIVRSADGNRTHWLVYDSASLKGASGETGAEGSVER
jgi:hypothetical protein